MSTTEPVQQFFTYCRIPGCRWYGNCKEIEHHFNIFHPYQKLSFNSKGSYFEMSFDDLQCKKPFLLSTNNGVYWFALNECEERPKQFSKGIFAIGGSERVHYYIKLGTLQTRIMEILGPFQAVEEKSDQYDFDIQLDYMERIKVTMTPKVVIYFGDFEEEADEYDEMAQLTPTKNTANLPDNCNYPTFVCSACVELTSGEPNFWRDRHYLCNECHQFVLSCINNPETIIN